MSRPVTHPAQRMITGPLAILAMTALILAAPVLLLRLAGNPLPGHLPTIDEVVQWLTQPDDGQLLLWALAAAGWVAWAVVAGSLLLELAAQLTGRPAPHLPGLGGPQRLAHMLVAVALATMTTSGISHAHAAHLNPPAAAAHDPGETSAAPHTTATSYTAVTPYAAAPITAAGQPVGPHRDGPPALAHEVATGDWMWHIAGRYLGDERRYPQIAALNPHLAGRYADYPDHIRPGDQLLLPPDARDSGARTHATGQPLAATDSPPVAADAVDDPPTQQAPPPVLGSGPPAPAITPSPVPPAATAPPASPAPDATAPTSGPLGSQHAQAPPAPVTGSTWPPVHAGEPSPAPSTTGLSPLLATGALASVLLGAVAAYRAAARAHRRYGRQVGSGRRAAEASIGSAANGDTARLDHALRALSAALAARDLSEPTTRLPDIGAVWIADGGIHLVLTTPTRMRPPPPWRTGEKGTWMLPADSPMPDLPDALAPLPALVTIGSSPYTHLLVDLERLGMLTVQGHPSACGDLLRHIAAELAHNPWSDRVEVTLAGFPDEDAALLASLNPRRIQVAESLPATVEQLRRRMTHNRETLRAHKLPDAMHGRVTDTAADTWTPRLLLVYATTDHHQQQLVDTLGGQLAAAGQRCAVLVAVAGSDNLPSHAATPGRVTITDDGRLTAAFLADGQLLTAASLPAHLLAPLADLLHEARDLGDYPIPAATEQWAAGTDSTGAPLAVSPEAAAVLRADTPTLPLPTITAAGGDQRSEPSRPGGTDDRGLDDGGLEDTGLDDTVTAWRNGHLPRVEILGPVRVTGAGPAPVQRRHACQELVFFLAARATAGATGDEIANHLWPQQRPPATVRTSVIADTRRWIGHTADGTPWLSHPDAGGHYRLHDELLVDWHLFRRLRTRSLRTGSTADLQAALRLVRGQPLHDATNPAGAYARPAYHWLTGSAFDPDLILAGVTDTVHDLVALCLASGDLDTARWAVQQAWLADPHRTDDQPWRDLMSIANTGVGPQPVRAVVAELLRWRDADHIDELVSATRTHITTLLGPGPVATPKDTVDRLWV